MMIDDLVTMMQNDIDMLLMMMMSMTDVGSHNRVSHHHTWLRHVVQVFLKKRIGTNPSFHPRWTSDLIR